MPTIRPETEADIPAVRTVYQRAFETPAEASLVDALRARRAGILSLVAELDGAVTGHIFFSAVEIKWPHGVFEAAGLAPMAVLPEFQNQGIGSALVRRGLEELRRMRLPAVIVLGHPEFYPRFGFAPASRWGIRFPLEVPDAAFMTLELQPGALQGVSGVAHFQPEFDLLT
ncbi:MAG: N-acetyltransferase [Anaerolineae bacterium]|nr:N-acetyltransferase [Anaerolineae bacterium]